MRRSIHLLALGGCVLGLGCRPREELPGPAIPLLDVVPADAPGPTSRSRGVMELYLTRADPSHTIWHDPDRRTKPWGTITLKRVDADGAAVIDLDGQELRAKPGRVFPGTGIKVIATNPSMDTALLRSRWTQTTMTEVKSPSSPGK